MVKHLIYLKHTLKHKWYVFKAARKLGITWRGLLHDLSKFNYDEWKPYTERHYNKYAKNEPVSEEFKKAFLTHLTRNAHHWQYWMQIVQVGHFPYCVSEPKRGSDWSSMSFIEVYQILNLPLPEGEVSGGYTMKMIKQVESTGVFYVYAGKMPEKYAKEMLADWIGAGEALNNGSVQKWYEKNKNNVFLHPETRQWIEQQIFN
jgi:hypothetical protein